MQIDEPMQEEQPAQEESSKEQDARVEQEEQPAQEKSIKEQATRVDIDLAKKGKSLNELLALMDAYSPVIPDTVTDYYLEKSGFKCNDQRVKRLLGLATQRFISDLATDSLQHSKLRTGQATAASTRAVKNPAKEKRAVLTMEDLSAALESRGVNASRPEYY